MTYAKPPDDQRIPVGNVGYNLDYLAWKRWDSEDFGKTSKVEERYFRAELKRTGLALGPETRILEVGFGNGNFLNFARQNSWDIHGTEVNPSLVETAKGKGFEVSHTESLESFPDETFDLVVAFDVLEHIPQEHILLLLTEIKNILKPDGYFIARFPNGDSPFGLANQNGDVTHLTAIGSGKIQYLVTELNVDLIYCGMETDIIWTSGEPWQTIRNGIGFCFKAIINLFVRAAFKQSNFTSRNLVFVFRKK